jgi:lactate permease
MSLLLLVIPFAVLLLFTVVFKKSLLISAAAGLLSVIMLIFFLGEFDTLKLAGAGLHGFLTALEIGVLIFGALAFYNFLKAGGFIQNLEKSIKEFSTNKLIIVILLSFYFGSFIEGVSGFGTPAMIIAPLLLSLRFPAYLAASLSLLANTIPVIFGAVGTPVKIGLADLPVQQTSVYAALLLMVPAVMLPFLFYKLLRKENLILQFNNTFLINFSAGFFFIIPFVLLAFSGPEFPSIGAPLAAILLWLFYLKTTGNALVTINIFTFRNFIKTFAPYLFICFLLVAGKFILGTTHYNIKWDAVALNKNTNFFQPGLVFILGLLMLYFLSKEKATISLPKIFRDTLLRLPPTLVTILCLTILARLLSQHLNIQELLPGVPSMLLYFLAVGTGFFGSFIAGSATVSNLMFGAEWAHVGQQFNLNISLLLATQLVGSALGNALSIQNIAMVQAVLKEKGLQSSIIKLLWKPLIAFVFIVSIAAVLIHFFEKQ